MFGLFKKKKYPKVVKGSDSSRFEVKIFPQQQKVKLAAPAELGIFTVAFIDWHLGYYGATPGLLAAYRAAVEGFIAQPGETWPVVESVEPENYVSRGGSWSGNGISGFGGVIGGPANADAAIIEGTKTLMAASGPDPQVIAAIKQLLIFSAEDDPAGHKYLRTHFDRVNEAWRLGA